MRTVPAGEKFVVLVTGCSEGGIGYGMCKAMAERGATVVATARRPEKMKDLHNLVATCLALDVTDEASISKAVQQVITEHGQIDLLINNAGAVSAPMSVVESKLKDWKEIYDVNVFGVVAVAKAVAPHMIARRKGRIVNISSIAGWNCVPFSAPYCSSKAAVHSLTQALRLELRPFNIQVMLVAPGFIRSQISHKSRGNEISYHGQLYKDAPSVLKHMNFLQDSTTKPGATRVELFSSQLADVAVRPLSKSVPTVWASGQFAGMIKLATAWLPSWVLDFVNANATGLDVMEWNRLWAGKKN